MSSEKKSFIYSHAIKKAKRFNIDYMLLCTYAFIHIIFKLYNLCFFGYHETRACFTFLSAKKNTGQRNDKLELLNENNDTNLWWDSTDADRKYTLRTGHTKVAWDTPK